MALKRVARTAGGFRSKFEAQIAEELKGVEFEYESLVIPYSRPSSSHKYTPDFSLANGIIIEAKGIWDADDRIKHLLIRQQHPHLDVRLLFQNANARLSKQSKTTYADYCRKHGIAFAHRHVPQGWLK